MRKNWLHLDLKGAIPSARKLAEFLVFWKECGFNGIVLEYDDRIPWQTWDIDSRIQYDMGELSYLLLKIKELNFEIIPLIQILGHLEWLLKHEKYHDWRENGVGSEICPLNSDVIEKFEEWIDEIVRLHPDSRFIHLGADETFYLGTCERCRQHSKKELYLNHISRMCEYVIAKKMSPLIWADIFRREKSVDSSIALPAGTILVDWQYAGIPPYSSTEDLKRSGCEVMGASGIMVGWWEQCYQLQSVPQYRIDNVTGWNKYGDESGLGIIHTTWTRAGSLWNIRAPWHGALPGFIAAGFPECWAAHPWNPFITQLTRIMERDIPCELEQAAADMLKLPVNGMIETESRRWWSLALRYQALAKELILLQSTCLCLNKVAGFVGRDQTMHYQACTKPLAELLIKVENWEVEARQYWQDNELSDSAEFFASHSDIVKEEIHRLTNLEGEKK